MENNIEEFAKLFEGYGTKEEKQNAANAQQAVTDLQNIQNMLQPYLVGSKAFDAKSLQQIQKKLSAPSTQQFFGRNNKKALQALQQINASINNKIKSLSQPAQEQPANNQQNNVEKPAENGSTNGNDAAGTTDGQAAPTTEQPKQPEQKGNAENIAAGDKNTISVQLQSLAKDLGKSEDDIIAYIKTL